MLFRFNYACALVAGASLLSLCSTERSFAAGGAWQAEGWREDGAQSSRSAETVTIPPEFSGTTSHAFTNGEHHAGGLRFTQYGREAWLADCRSRLQSQKLNSVLGESQQPLTRDECQVHLDNHNAQFIASVQNWAAQSGYVDASTGLVGKDCCSSTWREQACGTKIEYVYEDVTPRRQRQLPAIRRTNSVPDKRIKL